MKIQINKQQLESIIKEHIKQRTDKEGNIIKLTYEQKGFGYCKTVNDFDSFLTFSLEIEI